MLDTVFEKQQQWFSQTEIKQGYVFEPLRKAAIAYFKLECTNQETVSHEAKLTVHPAYTWLYPQLLAKMAQLLEGFPKCSLILASADYQSEREEYLEELGAKRLEHTLLMSRSVWHKLRETKRVERLQLADMLKGLQPNRTPVPMPISMWMEQEKINQEQGNSSDNSDLPSSGHHA